MPPAGAEAGRFRLREARREDAEVLAGSLREADRDEIAAATGETPLAVLERGIAASHPCSTVVDALDRPVALFGVVPDGRDRGLIWMLGSDGLTPGRITVFRRGRALIEELQRQYAVLENWVDARNTRHIQWLMWCGFRVVGRNEAYGVEHRPFLQVRRERGGQ